MQEQRNPQTSPVKPLLEVLSGRAQKRIPVWLMRQAGRYLPEYREVRACAGGFLDLVFNPALAAEVTLQPVRRFGMDAAIIFSDILVVPMMLGQNVKFTEGEGPALNPIRSVKDIPVLTQSLFEKSAAPIAETIRKVRENILTEGFENTALIGFAGAPWTVACYMVEGGSSRDFTHVKKWAYADPEGFSRLIDEIAETTALYLERQVEAGAEALQLFDSWAGVLDAAQFRRWVIEPTRYITRRLRLSYPDIPVIGFPRGAGRLYQDYAQNTDVAALSLDSQVPLRWAADVLQKLKPVQGSLDPVCLLAGGDALAAGAEYVLGNLSGGPFIFNLGHGILKETPPEHVEALVEIIRAWR